MRLTGFNWQSGRTGPDPGALMKKLAPNATMARLVGVLWDNTKPLQTHPNKECRTQEPPNYFNDKCFEDLDPWVRSATDAGLWVILAVRGEFSAGQDFETEPGESVFRNETLRTQMYAMWKHVAAHYASFDRIAAYEILSEPRDKTVDAAAVREFYEGGCAATREVDPRTPCLVGNAPYYKLWKFGNDTILTNTSNVIYTFDYFEPAQVIFSPATHFMCINQFVCASTCLALPHQKTSRSQSTALALPIRARLCTKAGARSAPLAAALSCPSIRVGTSTT